MINNDDLQVKISHLERSEKEVRKEIIDLKKKLEPLISFQVTLINNIKFIKWVSITIAAITAISGYILTLEKNIEERLRNGHTDHIMDKVESHIHNEFIEKGVTEKDPDPSGE